MIRSMRGAKSCSMRLMAWRGNRRGMRCSCRQTGFRQDDVRELLCRLPQTRPAQAVLTPDGHRQARRLLRAPAFAREVAAELGAAAGTGEAARLRFLQRNFFRNCHDLRKSLTVIFMSGSSPAAVY